MEVPPSAGEDVAPAPPPAALVAVAPFAVEALVVVVFPVKCILRFPCESPTNFHAVPLLLSGQFLLVDTLIN